MSFTFEGDDNQKTLVDEIFRLMMTQGSLFAADAAIKQTLTNLTDFLALQHKRDRAEMAQAIDAALRANSAIFAREEHNGEVVYVTSRVGRYVERIEDTSHMFQQRLHKPDAPLPIDDLSVVVSTSRPALTTVEPVFISDYWQRQAGMSPIVPPPPATEEATAPAVVAAPVVPVVAPLVTEAPPLPVSEPSVPVFAAPPVTPVITTEPVVEVVTPVVEVAAPVVVAPPPVVAAPVSVATKLIALNDGTLVDLTPTVDEIMATHGAKLTNQLVDRLEHDPLRRIVSFGRSYYPEASVVNLGKNDMRRIRDYILERNEPLLDTEIIADLYYHNPRQGDYEGFRFSLNYRLLREKDFEFVGVEGARLWSTRGLPALGTKRVKVSEMGQLTAFLLEEGYDDSTQLQSAEAVQQSGQATRILSFFEWEYGILPLDTQLSALLPDPMLPDQRTAVVRFDSPQHYTNYLIELRFATGNRGRWLQGLEDFFHQHLVPGALLTISRSPDSNIFTITYEEEAERNERLLTFDDKKNKFAFTNATLYCAVDDDQLLNQQRFGRMRNLKSFPMNDRRKTDMLLRHIFETLGEPVGTRSEPRYELSFKDLLVALNVLRPASRPFLLALLEADAAFVHAPSKPDTYHYTPAPEDQRASEENQAEEEEEEEGTGPYMPRGRRRYNEDA